MIYHLGICFMQKPFGGYFLRSVVPDPEFSKPQGHIPCDLDTGIRIFTKP